MFKNAANEDLCKNIFCWSCWLLHSLGSSSQVTVTNPGNATPALAATYTTLANAITALNAVTTFSGIVTIAVNPSNPQAAPAGDMLSVYSCYYSYKTVVIKGNNNVVVASNALTTGSLTDGIFKIVGCDFVTIEDFLIRENPSNTTTALATNNMTEWGYSHIEGIYRCRGTKQYYPEQQYSTQQNLCQQLWHLLQQQSPGRSAYSCI